MKKLISLLILLSVFNSCSFLTDADEIIKSIFLKGKVCNGKEILEFQSLAELQTEHRNLYSDYTNSQESEQVLIDYEDANNFYSLRKKDNEMDDGLIPNEPDFDPFLYTTDPIFETFLNQDGMIIINNELYLWDDGCMIQKAPFSCETYDALLDFRSIVLDIENGNNTQANIQSMTDLINNHNIAFIEICEDMRFDFETISEENLDVKYDSNPSTRSKSSGCGYEVFISAELLQNNPLTKIISYRISYSSITPPGTGSIQNFIIDDFAGNNVKIVGGSLTGIDWTNINWQGNIQAYPGEWFQIEVDYSGSTLAAPALAIRLDSWIDLFTGNSCYSTDQMVLDFSCPIAINKTSVNAQTGQWAFELQGLDNISNYSVTWNFGDGSTPTTILNSPGAPVHNFPIPCEKTTFSVTATIEKGGLCRNTVFSNVLVGDACKLAQFSLSDKSQKINNKKVRIKTKLRKTWFGSGSKLKHVFRCRASGDKTISTTGDIFKVAGITCNPVSINTITASKTTSGKKRNKVKSKTSRHLLDLNAPYTVDFSHSSGFNMSLVKAQACSQ